MSWQDESCHTTICDHTSSTKCHYRSVTLLAVTEVTVKQISNVRLPHDCLWIACKVKVNKPIIRRQTLG